MTKQEFETVDNMLTLKNKDRLKIEYYCYDSFNTVHVLNVELDGYKETFTVTDADHNTEERDNFFKIRTRAHYWGVLWT